MDIERKWAREYLKHVDKTSLRKLCHMAGFNDEETRDVTMFYGCLRSEDYIADFIGMSVDAYHKRKSLLLGRLAHFYHMRYPRSQSKEELERNLDELLRGTQ